MYIFHIFLICGLCFVQQAVGKKVDIKKEIEEHQTCNGEYVTLPPDWLADALVAGVACVSYEDDCFVACLAYTYKDGSIVKKNKVNMGYIRKESKKLELSEKNQKASEKLIKGIEVCGNGLPADADKPAPGETKCEWASKITNCLEKEFQKACKGKSSDSFLD